MTKKSNTKVKAKSQPIELHNIVKAAQAVVDIGGENALIIGMRKDESLVLNSTLPSFEQMHSLINRGMFEITINHHKYILSQINSEEQIVE